MSFTPSSHLGTDEIRVSDHLCSSVFTGRISCLQSFEICRGVLVIALAVSPLRFVDRVSIENKVCSLWILTIAATL